jgi:hypothetical protein
MLFVSRLYCVSRIASSPRIGRPWTCFLMSWIFLEFQSASLDWKRLLVSA